jgi:antitoxin component of MazEF toxin-antitoxin module
MKPVELKVARIGNSRGVRIPASTLARYRIEATVVMEERSDGILLRPPGVAAARLSWEDTAREMAAAREDWDVWDVTIADGLRDLSWDSPRGARVAEQTRKYGARSRKKQ